MRKPETTRAILTRQITAALTDVTLENACWTANVRDADSLRRLTTSLLYAAEKVEALRSLSTEAR